MKFILLTLLSFNSLAVFVYITDEVDIPIRKNKAFEDNIIRSTPSGTKLNVLQTSSDGWTKVQFENTIGWVISRYLTNNPPARNELSRLKINYNANKLLLKSQELKIKNLNQKLIDSTQENKNNKIQVLKARSEKKYIEKTYQNSLKLEHEVTSLKQKNLNLQAKVKLLTIGDKAKIENSNRTWFLYGGFILLLGVIIGFIMSKSKRR